MAEFPPIRRLRAADTRILIPGTIDFQQRRMTVRERLKPRFGFWGKYNGQYKDDFSDVMIPYVEFAENANERTPCILVLDCSGSMRGEPIKQLNTGLQALEKELKEDIDASSRVQLLVIKAYGKDDAEISADWVDAMNFTAPIMEASGLSPIGKAMELALQKIEEQKMSV